MKKLFLFITLFLFISVSSYSQNNPLHRNTATELAPTVNQNSDGSGFNNALNYGSRWFGQNAALTSFFTKGFLTTAATHTNFSPGSADLFGAMEFDNNGILYCIAVAAGSQLQRLDTTTGVLTPLGSITGINNEQVLGMSFNIVNSTMYITTITAGFDNLYKLNLSSRVATLVGSTGQNMFGIAINTQGQCYGVNLTDFLVSIDLSNGASAQIGAIGFDANFIQGLSFDRSTDSLWYAAYNNTVGQGQLRTVNLSTGATNLVGVFNPAAEICGFAIPTGSTPPPPSCSYGWSDQLSVIATSLLTTSTVSDLIGWSAGTGPAVRRTTDGGSTWSNATGTGITGDIYNIYAWSANDAICTTSPAATFIYKTSNGGSTWTQVYTLAGGFIDGLQMISATEGYGMGDPVGGTWTIVKTTDGGNTWNRMATEPVQVGAEAGWNNAFYIEGNNIWFNTNVSTVYRSTDLGLTWSSSPIAPVTSTTYGSVHFNSSTFGLASGSAGIVRSTDGGVSYTTAGTIPGTGNITALEGYANYFWYVRGTGVFISADGGLTFTSAFTATSGTFNDMDFAVNGCPSGWAVTSSGAIYKMSILTGISGTSEIIPDNYSLKQNYPNPFNPTTNINFSIPKSGLVTLKIYDMTGKEVATLVNEVKSAGSYLVGFNASNLPSGAYFYRVSSGNFVDTKKMMLIK